MHVPSKSSNANAHVHALVRSARVPNSCVHACMHATTCTRTHAQMHRTCTCMRQKISHKQARTYICTQARPPPTHISTPTHTPTQTQRHKQRHTRAHAHALVYMNVCKRPRVHTCSHECKCTCGHRLNICATHTCTRTQKCTRTTKRAFACLNSRPSSWTPPGIHCL